MKSALLLGESATYVLNCRDLLYLNLTLDHVARVSLPLHLPLVEDTKRVPSGQQRVGTTKVRRMRNVRDVHSLTSMAPADTVIETRILISCTIYHRYS